MDSSVFGTGLVQYTNSARDRLKGTLCLLFSFLTKWFYKIVNGSVA
jgi:hypothetical protein